MKGGRHNQEAVAHLVPLLDARREAALRAIVLAGVGTAIWFWLWWLASGHGTWNGGAIVATVLLAWLFGLSGYFFFFACRMTRPNPAVPLPALRVAMVVTKAPAEPWPVLERTLTAMLGQQTSLRHDVWLADERPVPETVRWCLRHGVQISSRWNVDDYHRPTWPRRTRCKEGNLAYFYDTVGYDRYDIVVQLDADHVPAPGYLEAMVRPFADPTVGYVAAPSVCDANLADSWAVRGRLYREATLHGPVQAGSNGGWGPVCIGSHYAIRTRALREVGGLGPELAEDYSTTLWLQSGGWDGVFAIDAEAHGDGPNGLEQLVTQERQWARSLATILVRYAPQRLLTVPLRARLRLGFAIAFYPLQTVVMVGATLLPILGVALGATWGNATFLEFYAHLWPASASALAAAAYLRRCEVLRPPTARLWSWELMLFQVIRWPWVAIGMAEGFVAAARGRSLPFAVTRKGRPEAAGVPWRALTPSLVLAGGLGAVAVGFGNGGAALGVTILVGGQAALYATAALVSCWLHLREGRRHGPAWALPQPVGPSPAG